MKTPFLLSLLLVMLQANCVFAQTEPVPTVAYTTPVGYISKDIPAGQTSYMGLSIHHPTLISSVTTEVNTNVLTDNNVDFATLLTSRTAYILHIESGSLAGTSHLLNRNAWRDNTTLDPWTQHSITLPEGIILEANTQYSLRKCATIADIFGAENELAKLKGSSKPASADKVNILDEFNTHRTFYYSHATPGSGYWKLIGGEPSLDNAQTPIFFEKPITITRTSGESKHVFTIGEAITTPRQLPLYDKTEFLNTGLATTSTLIESDLHSDSNWKKSSKAGSAYQLKLLDVSSVFTTYYCTSDNIWKKVGNNINQNTIPFSQPFYVFRNSTANAEYITIH